MNIKEALMEFCIFDPMIVTDLTGKVREEVIQVNLIVLAPKIEEALRKAIEAAFESGKSFSNNILVLHGGECVDIFIEELKK